MLSRDISAIEDAMGSITIRTNTAPPSTSALNDLKKALNKAFPDCVCEQIIYTKNEDKLFFGMAVYPDLTDDEVIHIIAGDEPVRVTKYVLEIDSKLLDPLLGLSSRELTAVVLHEVGHMTNTSSPVEEVRKAIDGYLALNDESIKIANHPNYIYILKFAIQDTLLKVTSVFYDKDEEFKADTFATKYGYGADLEAAMTKIYKNGLLLNKDVNDKFIVLAWALRLYKDVRLRRIAALRAINRAKSLSPSQTEKRTLDTLASKLKRIDDMSLMEAGPVSNAIKNNVYNIKIRGIKGFEADLYEYRMLIKNIDEQDEAILIMRQLNSRISILEDLIQERPNSTSKPELERLLDQFKETRQELAKTITYKDKFIGVVVNYPKIKGIDY